MSYHFLRAFSVIVLIRVFTSNLSWLEISSIPINLHLFNFARLESVNRSFSIFLLLFVAVENFAFLTLDEISYAIFLAC